MKKVHLPFIVFSAIIMLSGTAFNIRHVFAEDEQYGSTHFNAGVGVYSDSQFSIQGYKFQRDNNVYISAWSNAYYDHGPGLITTPYTNFTIDIVNPANVTVYHQRLTAGQDGTVQFSFPIDKNFTFGAYDVRYTAEQKGFKTITPYSPELDVHYSPSRFFVTWSNDDIIDVSDVYKIKVIGKVDSSGKVQQLDASPEEFGSYFRFNATMCPSPLPLISSQGFLEPTSDYIIDERDDPVMVVNANLTPLDEAAAGRVQNVSGLQREDTCAKPFGFQTGGLSASGKWSVTVSVQWLQKNDTQHVFQSKSDALTFDVAKTIYRSTDVKKISIDPDKFHNTLPLDWSPDGKSILFSYLEQPDAGLPALAVLTIDNLTTHKIDIPLENYGDGGYIGQNSAKFASNGTKVILLLGNDLYSYDLTTNSTKRLTNSGDIISFDIAPEKMLMYNREGNLVISDSDGMNAHVLFAAGDQMYAPDLSIDGTKILYRKIIDGGYEWHDGVLAYYDIEEKKEHVIPNIHNGCGEAPRWAPNEYNLVFHESSCSRGWPGGVLRMTDINGSFQESLVPPSNDNPAYFILNPEGNSILIGFTYSSSSTEGAVDILGGPANFYIMNLAHPVPEFGSYILLTVLLSTMIGGLLISQRLLSLNRK